jgi:hypothetical protein
LNLIFFNIILKISLLLFLVLKHNPEINEYQEFSEWQSKYKILESKDSVEDIKFAPRYVRSN